MISWLSENKYDLRHIGIFPYITIKIYAKLNIHSRTAYLAHLRPDLRLHTFHTVKHNVSNVVLKILSTPSFHGHLTGENAK